MWALTHIAFEEGLWLWNPASNQSQAFFLRSSNHAKEGMTAHLLGSGQPLVFQGLPAGYRAHGTSHELSALFPLTSSSA